MDSGVRSVACAIFDALTRRLTPSETKWVLASVPNDRKTAAIELCERRFSDLEGSLEKFERVLMDFVPEDTQRQLVIAMKALSTSPGCFALTGYWKPFHTLSPIQREKVLLSWSTSLIPPKRKLFKAFKSIAMFLYLGHPVNSSPNPNLKAIGYIPPTPMSPIPTYYRRIAACSIKPSGPLKLEADAVIIGTGVGGSMAAFQLCSNGYKVIIIDKGLSPIDRVLNPEQKSTNLNPNPNPNRNRIDEITSFENYYERGPYMLTEDGAINILAGNALGGGGTVNWFCSLDTPHYVRDEWSNKYGLKHFESPKFAKHLLSAKNLLGVQTSHVIHNKANNVLLKGCKELGFHCETAPQQGYPTGDENLCCMGSKRGERQGMLGSLLYDAAKTGNLRVFYECRANSVLTTTIGGKKKAIGVDAVSRSKHPITLRSKIVVSACGSLHTPLLLRRSGLVNKHIGRNLRLHPVTGVYAQFKEEINAFEGAPMTTVSNVVANLDGKGYGARLEVPSIHPSLMASSLNWRGAAAAKADMLKALRFSLLIVLTRDSGSGRVYSDAKHQPRIEYSLRRKDANHMIKGVEMACRVLMAAGAEVIHTVQSGIEAYHCTDQGVADPTFHKWIKRVKQVGPKPNQCPLFSAHQMGTCKMGINPTQGGVKPSGETWEVDGLYVCDTSVFPTPSGTNPMVTVAAVTYGISQNLRLALARLKRATVDLRSKL